MKKALVALAVVVALGLAAVGGAFVWVKSGAEAAMGAPDAPDEIFVVDKGVSGRGVGAALVKAGFIGNLWFWRFYLRSHPSFSPKAGKHALSKKLTLPQIADELQRSPIPESKPFTMIEGWRLRDTDAALVEQGLIKPGEYIAAASTSAGYKAPFPLPARGLEGYLYPETYAVDVDKPVDVRALVQRQLDSFVERFYGPHAKEVEASGRTLDQIVIVASMLEREEPTPAQRPIVAGIMWKRVAMNFPLGIDATSRYSLAEWNDRKEFLKKLRDPSDPYNTRHSPGLPPGPIGAPTVASLQAALRPQMSDFLYYLHDADRVLHPSRNAAEHEALRKQYNVY
jgi:UPF0755 protein